VRDIAAPATGQDGQDRRERALDRTIRGKAAVRQQPVKADRHAQTGQHQQ